MGNQKIVATKGAYDAHQKELAISYGVIETAKYEGRIEEKMELVVNGYKNGLGIDILAKITSLDEKKVTQILIEKGFTV